MPYEVRGNGGGGGEGDTYAILDAVELRGAKLFFRSVTPIVRANFSMEDLVSMSANNL